MKKTKIFLTAVVIFLATIPLFSFSTLENPPVDAIRIVKNNDNTYIYLSQDINFSLNETTINDNCKQQLYLVVYYLKKHPNLKIEIGVHNDLRTKKDLTQIRANVLKRFFERHKVNPKNIIAVGYDKSELLYDCKDKNNVCTEIQQQANRRIELKILNPDALNKYVVINKAMSKVVKREIKQDKNEAVAKETGVEEKPAIASESVSEGVKSNEIVNETATESTEEKPAVSESATKQVFVKANKENPVIASESVSEEIEGNDFEEEPEIRLIK